MCILYFCQSEIWQPNGYRLILANNRDEFWDRPTKLADFWNNNPKCISGLDLEPGREGGTWLGVSTSGKVGVLLNILGQQHPNKEGRGHIVTDYISGSQDADMFGSTVHEEREKYNGFNLILFDVGRQEESLSVKPTYISNAAEYWSCVTNRTLPSNTFFGVSNSPLEYPFKKVEIGKEKFGKIVCQFPYTNTKPHLINNLLELMQDQSHLLPDPVLEGATSSLSSFCPTRLQQHSAINVHSPAHRYGSRTSTVILIDSDGGVDYVERTKIYDRQDPETDNSFTLIHKAFSLDAPTSSTPV